MYLEMAVEEDKKMAESWKADAEGILVFVRIHMFLSILRTDSSLVDRFILCRCRVVDLGVGSGYSTEPTGHVQLLPCEYLSDCRRPKSIHHLQLPSCFTAPIFSTKLCRLGEFTLVLELGDKPYLCSTRNITAAVGTKIPQSHSTTLHFTQADPDPCILC